MLYPNDRIRYPLYWSYLYTLSVKSVGLTCLKSPLEIPENIESPAEPEEYLRSVKTLRFIVPVPGLFNGSVLKTNLDQNPPRKANFVLPGVFSSMSTLAGIIDSAQ